MTGKKRNMDNDKSDTSLNMSTRLLSSLSLAKAYVNKIVANNKFASKKSASSRNVAKRPVVGSGTITTDVVPRVSKQPTEFCQTPGPNPLQ